MCLYSEYSAVSLLVEPQVDECVHCETVYLVAL